MRYNDGPLWLHLNCHGDQQAVFQCILLTGDTPILAQEGLWQDHHLTCPPLGYMAHLCPSTTGIKCPNLIYTLSQVFEVLQAFKGAVYWWCEGRQDIWRDREGRGTGKDAQLPSLTPLPLCTDSVRRNSFITSYLQGLTDGKPQSMWRVFR